MKNSIHCITFVPVIHSTRFQRDISKCLFLSYSLAVSRLKMDFGTSLLDHFQIQDIAHDPLL